MDLCCEVQWDWQCPKQTQQQNQHWEVPDLMLPQSEQNRAKQKEQPPWYVAGKLTWHHDEMMHDPNEKRATEPCKCNSAKPTSWLGQGHNIVQAHPITHYHHGVASKEDPGYVPVVFRTWLACFGAVIQSVLEAVATGHSVASAARRHSDFAEVKTP